MSNLLNNSFSKLQQQASDPKYSVYVNASAGTGKTKILIDRMIRLFLSGSSISSIICITFTNNAADEMFDRLRSKAEHWLLCSLDVLKIELEVLTNNKPNNLELERARSLYSEIVINRDCLKIQTIHSFCAGLLGFFTESDSKKVILSEAERRQLLVQAFDNILNSDSLDSTAIGSLKILANLYDYNAILEYVLSTINHKIKFFNYIVHAANADGIKDLIFKNFSIDHSKTEVDLISEYLLSLNLQKILEILPILNEFNDKAAQTLEEWIKYDFEKKVREFSVFKAVFLTKNGEPRIKIIKSEVSKKYIDIELFLREIQQALYTVQQKVNEYYSAKHCAALAIIAAAVLKEYEFLKKNLLDYDDILLNAINLLKSAGHSSWVLQQLDMSISHILVDEAQDLSKVQWTIIDILSEDFFAGEGAVEENRTIFIVGDLKQSIFSFQGAEPEIFRQVCVYYQNKVTAAGKEWLQIDMNTSFRSSFAVLEVVDTIFEQPHNYGKLGLLSYHKHISNRRTVGKFELWPIISVCSDIKEKKKKIEWEIPNDATDTEDSRYSLAYFIAKTIYDWLRLGKKIREEKHLIKANDIMIIVRKRGAFQDYLTMALKSFNLQISINSAAEASINIVTQDILSIMKFIANPDDDLNLACLLKSPIINIDEQILFDLCYDRGVNSVWNVIQEKNCLIKAELEEILKLASNNSIYNCFHILFFKMGKMDSITSRLGNQAEYIIHKILDKVLEFEELFPTKRFDTFIEWFKSEGLKIRENYDGIQIHTVHSAKGLQAPIVILADASDSENIPTDSIIWDQERFFFSSGAQYDGVTLKNLKDKHRNNRYAENLRLLYVALTRAEDELYICGWANNKLNDNWYQVIEKAMHSRN